LCQFVLKIRAKSNPSVILDTATIVLSALVQ
jgi:hypothetical protein